MRYNVISLAGDDMDITFSSKEELYDRVKPALNAKVQEMHRLGYSYITIQDVWNYLIQVKWLISKDLTLADLIHDILHAENKKIDEYLKGKLSKTRRSQYFDNELI